MLVRVGKGDDVVSSPRMRLIFSIVVAVLLLLGLGVVATPEDEILGGLQPYYIGGEEQRLSHPVR
jgi:hypothetical protein